MKITRSQLKRLINEAISKSSRPLRSQSISESFLDRIMKKKFDKQKQSNARIDSMLSQKEKDNLAKFDKEDPDYAEQLRLGLDPDRPVIKRYRLEKTILAVPVFYQTQARVEILLPKRHRVEIPQELVDGLIAKHHDEWYDDDEFAQSAYDIFNYIREVIEDDTFFSVPQNSKPPYIQPHYKSMEDHGRYVFGYRAIEFEEVMDCALLFAPKSVL